MQHGFFNLFVQCLTNSCRKLAKFASCFYAVLVNYVGGITKPAVTGSSSLAGELT